MNKISKIMYRKKKCSLRTYFRWIFLILIATYSSVLVLVFALRNRKPSRFTSYTCQDSAEMEGRASLFNYHAILQGHLCKHHFNDSVLNNQRKLDLEGEDVLIFLHIQKTGGATFGRHLVNNLGVESPCKCVAGVKKCECLTSSRRRWLFSRHATGWMCGLHADWTEMADCVDDWFKHNDVKSRQQRT